MSKCREEFEKWFLSQFPKHESYLSRITFDDYDETAIRHRWQAWQAAWQARPSSRGEAVGFRYRVCPKEYRGRKWEGYGIVSEWNKPVPAENDTIEYQELFSHPSPGVVAGEVVLALAAKWREQAELNPLFLDGDYCQAKNDCADELTAAIGRGDGKL